MFLEMAYELLEQEPQRSAAGEEIDDRPKPPRSIRKQVNGY